MKLNTFPPVSSYASTAGTMRFSASNSSKTDLTQGSGEEGDSFSFHREPSPQLGKAAQLKDLDEQLKKARATAEYKAYDKDAQKHEEMTDRNQWKNAAEEEAANDALLEKHAAILDRIDALVQQKMRLDGNVQIIRKNETTTD